VPVPAGDGYILLRFEDTPLRATAKWVTYCAFVLLILGALVGMWRHRHTRRLSSESA
jgi:hypothetical protein